MLSSTKSRRILHLISVTLALLVFGYGLFLKLNKPVGPSDELNIFPSELVNQIELEGLMLDEEINMTDPD